MSSRKKRERLKRLQKTQEQRLKAEANRRISEIKRTHALEAADKDFDRTRDELLAAQEEYQERLLKTKDPVVGALLIWIINTVAWGIAKMDTTPREEFLPGTFKVLNRHTGRDYRKVVSVVVKSVFRRTPDVKTRPQPEAVSPAITGIRGVKWIPSCSILGETDFKRSLWMVSKEAKAQLSPPSPSKKLGISDLLYRGRQVGCPRQCGPVTTGSSRIGREMAPQRSR